MVRSAISAGVNTAVYGGSFGQAFAGGLVKDAAAVAANGIGGSEHTPEGSLSNVLSHALLGCAAQSLGGGDCAGGAIGGAASALLAPLIRDQVYADSEVLTYNEDRIRQAITVGLSTLVGGLAGAALGVDVTSAGLAAQNEAINNTLTQAPPYARKVAADLSGRLYQECGTSCTTEDFKRIDELRQDAATAAMLSRMNTLTPEQALKLADTLSNLLPYYGSAAMLFQAVTGQTLSGQSLDTVDRWLSGILGAIPVGAAVYGKIVERLGARGVDAGIQWGKGVANKGMPWEDYLATKMPAGSRLPPNFRTFDFYDEATGVATSAKTLDTTTASKIANPTQIYSAIKSNIDKAANFKEASLSGVTLTAENITAKELQLAVPSTTTSAQWEQINRAIEYGKSQGVTLIVTKAK